MTADAIITDIEEETLDFDWFAVDRSNEIAHFATGGQGFLPWSVKSSRYNLERLVDHFRQLPHICEFIESPRLMLYEQFGSDSDKARFLESFAGFAKKGMFSFDCFLRNERPTSYHLVGIPAVPLKLFDVPAELQPILNMTKYSGSFSSADIINVYNMFDVGS